jgi:hydrogenase nickel incorporation protein HypA/HybF
VHELSIALSIVTAVQELAAARAFDRIDAVTLQIGEFAGVDKDALSFAWELAAADSVAAGSRLEFRDVRLRVRCPVCGVEREPPNRYELACPTCPGAAPEFLAGRELHVVSVEVPNEDGGRGGAP